MKFRRLNFRNSVALALVSGILVFAASPVHAAPLANADVKYARVGDVKLAYYLRGQGEPLIMIMGFAGTMALWDPALVDELAKNHLLIMFDNRGAGLSTDTAENHTTMAQMADDTAGLIKALGFNKADVLAWSMGARIGQQLFIRHPEVVNKGILCAPDPGGSHSVPIDPDVGAKLNNPNGTIADFADLAFTTDATGRLAAQESLSRIRAAAANGTAPDDFQISAETKSRQVNARTTLWSADDSNFEDLKNIDLPVLVADGRYDIIDKPENSTIVASQIPFAWLAFFDGGHAFLYQQHERFTKTVNAFLQ